ncbi:5-formyltetrahydrofolate cyclo-ligase [Sulfurovum sp.]|uniref:5-formyltetrahydrofolate cyclo-ligase n=1 Tax=Sulfurovum sp. TaxID=1969726 RepID=UPI0025E11833|nr:5-formyltetrahydrofolate cyclo-ligase [Sulfurovum sp.]
MEVMQKKMRKQKFRRHCLEQLKKSSRTGRYAKDKKVLSVLHRIISEMNARTVMLYLPLATEVNLYPLVKVLRREKRQLYVPFMEGKSFRLVKYRYPLETKQFGIKEPKNSKQYRNKEIDIAIVPIVGVDLTYRRVGFGKGMYDRFFEKEMKNIKKTVFVARHLCFSSQIVTDSYDVRADMIIVP